MKGKLASRPTVKLNIVISRNSQRFSVCGERVVCNWVMEKVVNVRGNHGFKRRVGRSSSLLPLYRLANTLDQLEMIRDFVDRSYDTHIPSSN